MNLLTVSGIKKKEVPISKDFRDIAENAYPNGFNSAVSLLEGMEVSEERLAKVIADFYNKNSLLYDGCKNVSKLIIETMNPNHKDSWIIRKDKEYGNV